MKTVESWSARLHWCFICLICPNNCFKAKSSLCSQCPSFMSSVKFWHCAKYNDNTLPYWYFFQAWRENGQRSTRSESCPFETSGQRSPLTPTDVHLTDDLLIFDRVHSRLQEPKERVGQHLCVFSQGSNQQLWHNALVEPVCPLQAVRWSVALWRTGYQAAAVKWNMDTK